MKSLCPLSARKFLVVDHPGTACDTALIYENKHVCPYRRHGRSFLLARLWSWTLVNFAGHWRMDWPLLIWAAFLVASILIIDIIIIILSITNTLAFNLLTLDFNVTYFFRNQEKAPTPLLQHGTGEPAVTHPYMSIKCLLLNTRRMGDFLALKIRPAKMEGLADECCCCCLGIESKSKIYSYIDPGVIIYFKSSSSKTLESYKKINISRSFSYFLVNFMYLKTSCRSLNGKNIIQNKLIMIFYCL